MFVLGLFLGIVIGIVITWFLEWVRICYRIYLPFSRFLVIPDKCDKCGMKRKAILDVNQIKEPFSDEIKDEKGNLKYIEIWFKYTTEGFSGLESKSKHFRLLPNEAEKLSKKIIKKMKIWKLKR